MAKTLEAVLVGCGGMSGAWLKVIQEIPSVRIVGLVDVMEANAQRRREEFGLTVAEVGSELDPMLRLKRPDLVLDCTVPSAHVGVTLTALRRGCHVLGEKPMAETLADARRMVAAARRANRIYAVIQNRRYLNSINGFCNPLHNKHLGVIHTVCADFRIGAHFRGRVPGSDAACVVDRHDHPYLRSGALPDRVGTEVGDMS